MGYMMVREFQNSRPLTGGQLGDCLLIFYGCQGNFGFKFRAVLFSFSTHCQFLSFGIDSELNTLFVFWGPPYLCKKFNASLIHSGHAFSSKIEF